MHSLRYYIDLVEARVKPTVRPSLAGQAPRISSLMQALAPLGLRFNKEWATAVQADVQTRQAHEAEQAKKDSERYGEPVEYTFDEREALSEVAEQRWQQWRGMFSIRKDIEHHEEDYMQRARERLGDGSFNPGTEVESSDYLSGMAAQQRCAEMLNVFSLPEVLDPIQSFVGQWQRYETADDGGEDPALMEGFLHGLERLMPLLLLLSKSTIT